MGAYLSALGDDVVYDADFSSIEVVVINVALITNILVFSLLLIQMIRHRKWNYYLYWCFTVQSVFASLLVAVSHPLFWDIEICGRIVYLFRNQIVCLWCQCGIVTVVVWEYTFLRNRSRALKIIISTSIFCLFAIILDNFELPVLVALRTLTCDWNSTTADTYPYYVECMAFVSIYGLIIYLPSFLQAGLLVFCMHNVFTLPMDNASKITLQAHRKISRAFIVKLVIIALSTVETICQYRYWILNRREVLWGTGGAPIEPPLLTAIADISNIVAYLCMALHGLLVVWLLSRVLLKVSTIPRSQSNISGATLSSTIRP